MGAFQIAGTIETVTTPLGSVGSKPINGAVIPASLLPNTQGIIQCGMDTVDLQFPIASDASGDLVLANQSAAGATLTITWTPLGGSSATVVTLNPGSVLVISSGAMGLISAISITGSGSDAACQFVIMPSL